jgi:predicted DNA-binding transcriptional regulator AlpA
MTTEVTILIPGRLIKLTEVLKIIPVCKSAWFAGVKTGKFPAPVALGERSRAYRTEDIAKLVKQGV